MRMPWGKLGEEGVWEYVNLFLHEMKRLLSCWRINEKLNERSSLQVKEPIKARGRQDQNIYTTSSTINNH